MALYLGRQKIAPVVNTIDVTLADATESDVLQGKKFYNAQGELVVGTYIDIMNRYLAVKKSCYNLFSNFQDEDMSWLNGLDTTGVNTMQGMFTNCINAKMIDVSSFNTSNVTRMDSMFNTCISLLTLDVSSFNTSKVTNMSSMFFQVPATVLNLSNFDTSKVTNAYAMFYNCTKLKTIIGTLDLYSVNDVQYMFLSCGKLEDVTLKNIKISLQLGGGTSYGTLLTNESLINTFKELWDLTGSTSQTLTLSTTSKNNIANIYVKLIPVTDEMRAEDQYIDNKKPCVVCESTDVGAMTLTEYAISKNWAIG